MDTPKVLNEALAVQVFGLLSPQMTSDTSPPILISLVYLYVI
jgi:hypothetical protein